MKYLYALLVSLSFLLIPGCSGSSDENTRIIDSTSIETCYDVQITNAGISQTKNICTTRENGGFNGLGTVRFIKLNVVSTTTVTVQATRTSGLDPADPDIVIYKNGDVVNSAEGDGRNTELLSTSLSAGNYVIEINEYNYEAGDEKIQPVIVNPYQQKTTGEVRLQSSDLGISTCVGGNDSIVSGRLTFHRVNHLGTSLNYSDISVLPIQQAQVEVICNDGIYSSISSDTNGQYSLNFPDNQSSFVRVKAQMLNGSQWDFSVVDNTKQTQPVYAMDSSSFTVSVDIVRDLNAPSGWDQNLNRYDNQNRVAAPFAILDSIRKARNKVLSVVNTGFPALKINWSIDNSTDTILGSYYDVNLNEIFLLGKENNDTDEYDEHVIIHEWGHYFEANFSRSDSIGGIHGRGDILDIRVAFGEGFGNAFSSIVTDDAFYIDTIGPQQGRGFFIDMENNNCSNAGWYSECSVQSILYDIYDANNENADSLSLNFSFIYNVLVGSQKNTEAMTSIFSFIKPFKDQNSGFVNEIDALLNFQNIDPVSDIYGSSQISLNPGATNQLPIYQTY